MPAIVSAAHAVTQAVLVQLGRRSMLKPGFTIRVASGLVALAICCAAFTFAGCERKERVLDVRTPGGDVKVDRNIDNGKVEVEVKHK